MHPIWRVGFTEYLKYWRSLVEHEEQGDFLIQSPVVLLGSNVLSLQNLITA